MWREEGRRTGCPAPPPCRRRTPPRAEGQPRRDIIHGVDTRAESGGAISPPATRPWVYVRTRVALDETPSRHPSSPSSPPTNYPSTRLRRGRLDVTTLYTRTAQKKKRKHKQTSKEQIKHAPTHKKRKMSPAGPTPSQGCRPMRYQSQRRGVRSHRSHSAPRSLASITDQPAHLASTAAWPGSFPSPAMGA